MMIGCEVFHNLKKVIKKKFGGDATLIGDEGGFAPPCNVESGLQMIMEAAAAAGYTDKISVGLDVAASEFKVKGQNAYDLDFKTTGDKKDSSLMKSGDEMIAFYKQLVSEYPIVSKYIVCCLIASYRDCVFVEKIPVVSHGYFSYPISCIIMLSIIIVIAAIEDPFDQDDWANWTKICAEIGDKVQIVGDDLTVTNPLKIQEAINKKSCNALLLKVNQIGSISESIDAVKLSKQNGWGVMCSHRSGETEDNYIADLAVGLCTAEIKTVRFVCAPVVVVVVASDGCSKAFVQQFLIGAYPLTHSCGITFSSLYRNRVPLAVVNVLPSTTSCSVSRPN
jgi:enolase